MILYSPYLVALALIVAVIIDWFLGEPKKWHPLVAYGHWASFVEKMLWQQQGDSPSRLPGVLALLMTIAIVLVPALTLHYVIVGLPFVYFLFSSVIVYLCIAPRSLKEHAQAIAAPLLAGDLPLAREKLSMIVSRDTQALSEAEISTAVCESILENGSDGIFAAMFWFVVAGIPGVVLYRAANTLDAMWGYKNERFLHFGWAAAKFDDLLNYLPARLVALSYALLGDFSSSIKCWSTQSREWKSPNAGPVMSAGAGALNIILGGKAQYDGEYQQRPELGCGNVASVKDISSALRLIQRTVFLWLTVVALLAISL